MRTLPLPALALATSVQIEERECDSSANATRIEAELNDHTHSVHRRILGRVGRVQHAYNKEAIDQYSKMVFAILTTATDF